MPLKIEVEEEWGIVKKTQALVGHKIGRHSAPLKISICISWQIHFCLTFLEDATLLGTE